MINWNDNDIIVELSRRNNISEDSIKEIVRIVSSYIGRKSSVAGLGLRLPDNRKGYLTYPAQALDKLEVSLNVKGGLPPVGTVDGPTIAGA